MTSFFASSSIGPFGWTGQPRWTQRLKMVVKLGTPSSVRPLLRMNAVRRETSPCSGLSRYVAITYWPSGKFEIGPRSTSNVSTPSPMNDGSTPKPRAGSVTPGADQAADADRREREERRAVDVVAEIRLRRDGRDVRQAGRGGGDGMAHEQVAHPEEAEDERDDRADDQHGDADDQPDEDARDADGEADRPEARARQVVGVVLVVHSVILSVPCSGS